MSGILSQPTDQGKGIDGVVVMPGDDAARNTLYGGNTEGVVSRMTKQDSSLLTGIANVIGGIASKETSYHALDYFTTRTPRAQRSYHQDLALGKNANGSGTTRAQFTPAALYPDQILNNNDIEFVPVRPNTGSTIGSLKQLIPKTPADEESSPDHMEDPNADPAAGVGTNSADSNNNDNPGGHQLTTKVEENSVIAVNTTGGSGDILTVENLASSEGGDNTFTPSDRPMGTNSHAASSGAYTDYEMEMMLNSFDPVSMMMS